MVLRLAISEWILVLAGSSQSLAGLWLAPFPLLLLMLLLQLHHPNHQFGHDRAPRLLEACVLVKVPTGMTDVEPLR
jgi:hypothetical protein